MIVLLSPAKKMREDLDTLPPRSVSDFLDRTQILLDALRSLSAAQQKKVWNCNDKIADVNHRRIARMNLLEADTPAVFAFQGIQYTYMAPQVMTGSALDYLQDHVRILSGFYGLLRPFDAVTPYRLEMQAKGLLPEGQTLYQFWGRCLYDAAVRVSSTFLNLASQEYSKCIQPYLRPGDRMITCIFGEDEGDGRVRQKGTQCKMARGDCVRFLAENGIENPEEVRSYAGLGYRFCPERSDDTTYTLLK